MRDFARGQRCGSLISTFASVQECPDLTRAWNSTSASFLTCCYFINSQKVAGSESPFGRKITTFIIPTVEKFEYCKMPSKQMFFVLVYHRIETESAVRQMYLFTWADQAFAILVVFLVEQFCVVLFENSTKGRASILLEGDNGASAAPGLFSIVAVVVAQRRKVQLALKL